MSLPWPFPGRSNFSKGTEIYLGKQLALLKIISPMHLADRQRLYRTCTYWSYHSHARSNCSLWARLQIYTNSWFPHSMSALNKIYHKYMWFLEHMENHRSSCGRSGRSWSHGTDCWNNQCWHKASQAAGGAGDTLCMCFSGLSQDCWHDNQSSFFPPSFHALYCFLQRTVKLTSLPSVMLQVQLQFLWSLEIPGNLETNFFFFQILLRLDEL